MTTAKTKNKLVERSTDAAYLYANDVVSGKVLACKFVKDACNRHLNDLQRDFEYYYDSEESQRWFDLFELLNLWKGEWAGGKFVLEPWQKFIIGSLFGWRSKKDKTRRFKKAYLEMARKNAKTTMMAGIAIGMLTIDNENGGGVYAGATKEAQARIVVNDVAKILKSSPDVYMGDGEKNFSVFELRGEAHRVVCNLTNSFMTALGRDSKSQDGLDVSCAIIDEYHAHKSDDLKQVLESGMGARKQPLLCIITTAGFDKTGPCFQYRRMIIDILQGDKKDENTFGIIYTLDAEDDWQDSANWIKSNPNLGVSVKPDFLKTEMVDAINQPSKQTAFLTKNLNLWVDAPDVWIPDQVWKSCENYKSLDELSGPCWMGLDLASVSDMTCLHLYFPDYNYFKPIFFCPKDTAKRREREENIPYQTWADEGWIILTDGGGGKVTDYRYIMKFIGELNEDIEVKTIAFDKFNSSQLVVELSNNGYNMQPFSQVMSMLNYPTKEFEKMAMSNRLEHDGNPCMAWMMKNVFIIQDSNDNIKIDKKKSYEKVDGPVAAIMALGQHIIDTNEPEEQYFFA